MSISHFCLTNNRLSKTLSMSYHTGHCNAGPIHVSIASKTLQETCAHIVVALELHKSAIDDANLRGGKVAAQQYVCGVGNRDRGEANYLEGRLPHCANEISCSPSTVWHDA